MRPTKRIFNSVEEIKEVYGIDVKLPDCIPDGCNVISYGIIDLYGYIFGDYYKVNNYGLFVFSKGVWVDTCNIHVEDEVSDDVENGYNYIYLRLTQQGKKDKFTPERLLGVETNEGFINKLNQNIKGFVNIGYTTCDPRELKYYISDYSDETVPFDEYVDIFYERASL